MDTAEQAGLETEALYLFNTGSQYFSYRWLGAHLITFNRRRGVRFAVWAPEAAAVAVAGDFNEWSVTTHQMTLLPEFGIWWCFIPGLKEGARYKFAVESASGHVQLKADPFAFQSELRPATASIVTRLNRHRWKDRAWQIAKRRQRSYERPMLTYEVHPGSWKIKGKELFYTYEELAVELVDYAVEMGYTHIELMPITEHPFDRSWGYQTTGYFAATSRYGTPEQLMKFVDRCHQMNIGVILDWVPGHFCKDDHGLRLFDGSPLYEGPNAKRAEKPLWGTLSFDFGRSEVQSFLLSSAMFWMDVYHIDGLRVDAVASMVDLHFDKPPELHTLNIYGGTDYLEALDFLKRLNETVFHYYPQALMIAEDSSSRPGVTKPTDVGGLGFNYKWNMGWMNDMLRYMELHPTERPAQHSLITFSLMYAFNENFVLPLSHDEVVHGKKSLLNKMPGSYEEKFAQLRLFMGYWMTHPGKKLLFMGGEWGHFDEWKDLDQLDWMLLEYPAHQSFHSYMKSLNHYYAQDDALWELDCESEGFRWIDVHEAARSIIAFERQGRKAGSCSLVICNFSNGHYVYRLGVEKEGIYRKVFSSEGPPAPLETDEGVEAWKATSRKDITGEDTTGANTTGADTTACVTVSEAWHGRPFHIELNLAPYSFTILKHEEDGFPTSAEGE